MMKLDSKGERQWQSLFGADDDDFARSRKNTSDGGFIAVGYSWSDDIPGVHNNGVVDIHIVKTDQYGEVEWQ